MGVQVIPIPTEVVSHSLPFPFPILCFIPIPMGFAWDSLSHWESHSHKHLYCVTATPQVNGQPWSKLDHIHRIETMESTVEKIGTFDEVPGATHTPNLMTIRSRGISGQIGEI